MTTPKRPGGDLYYDVMQVWRDQCLVGDSSLFTPGQPIWSPATVEDLCSRFIDSPDEGSGTFFEKLEGQLKDAPDTTVQLAAELLFIHFVGVLDIRVNTKTNQVGRILKWMKQPVDVPPDVARALEGGFAKTGVAYKAYRPFQTWQILTLARELKKLDRPARSRVLADPWEFKGFLFAHPVRAANTQRNALLHLMFPDVFEPSVSESHKRQIAEAFSEHVREGEEDMDRQLASIRAALQEEGQPSINFYAAELREQWDTTPDPVVSPAQPGSKLSVEAVLGTLYADEGVRRFAANELLRSVDLARAGGEEVWGTSLFRKRIRLNVGRMQVLVLRQDDVIYVLEGTRFDDDRYAALRPFLRKDPGQYKSHPTAIDIALPADRLEELAPLARELHAPLVKDLAGRYRRTPYKHRHTPEVVSWISSWLGLDGHKGTTRTSLADLESELYFPEGSLETVVTLLHDKGQVILCGPPGTGKTFVARRLAESVAGTPERVEKVQLHPSYAYEDFVEGYRPTLVDGRPGFVLKDGPLKRIAEAARQDPDHTYVLLVDEINRGNLAKVFGELYYLLEYRDDALRLPYSEKPFSLPKNLRLIGTMNTADRSIALVDLALRRRFHFVEFYPDRDPVRDVLRAWLAGNVPSMSWVADVVDRANELLGDRDSAIGASYFLRPDLDEEVLELVWEHSVKPFLAEQLYGESERLKSFDLGALRSSIESSE